VRAEICAILSDARLFYGHGYQDAEHEADAILAHLGIDVDASALDSNSELSRQAVQFARERAESKKPLPYVLGRAWQDVFEFDVDERVLIPRSYIAEFLLDGTLDSWFGDTPPPTILEIGTGSGALIIIAGHVYPDAALHGSDISAEALSVARNNRAHYGMDDTLHLHLADVFNGVPIALLGKIDLLISNPPYVTLDAMQALPPEYLHEPALALAAGDDGLDIVRRILSAAKNWLSPTGVAIIEVGNNRALVEHAYPQLELFWLTGLAHEDAVFVVSAEALQALT
jgi:ribosomal protein L3 glutamine methyltransferase